MSDHPDPVWDCTFHNSIRPKIYTKEAIDVPHIKLRKDTDGYLKGFDIAINNMDIPGAEKESEKQADNLKKILIIKSGMTIKLWSTGFECRNKVTGRRHSSSILTSSYGIEGGIEKLDLMDPTIQSILNSGSNPTLGYLSNAISHLYEGRLGDSIQGAFRIIEKDTGSTKDYWKYNCIRNILTHKKLEPHVIKNFLTHFGPDVYAAFDFEQYNPDPNNGIIILNLESSKTRTTLNSIAKDLINECRKILSL